MDEAAANEHLEVVRFLHRNRQEGCTKRAMNLAAMQNHLEFLAENRNEWCLLSTLGDTASRGHVEIVKYRFAYFYAIDSAIDKGFDEIVAYLKEVHPDIRHCGVFRCPFWKSMRGAECFAAGFGDERVTPPKA